MRLGTPEFLASPQFLVTGADDRGVTSEKTGLGRRCRRSDMSEAIRILHAMRRLWHAPAYKMGTGDSSGDSMWRSGPMGRETRHNRVVETANAPESSRGLASASMRQAKVLLFPAQVHLFPT
jgi:hypothetical protein